LKQLRTLHERLDRAVLDAYGWSDVAVPAYSAASDAFHGARTFRAKKPEELFVISSSPVFSTSCDLS
jgi:hypothetical protein